MEDAAGPRRSWTDEETILALYLYFQLPFGRLHAGNPEIRHLASSIHRSSSSVAMKLCNFASLDPKITETGRKGLAGASKRDRALYAAFSQDWTGLVGRAESLWQSRVDPSEQRQTQPAVRDTRDDFRFQPWQGASTSQALIEQRVGQGFFRRAVLANYEERCAITGIADPRLLVASHITKFPAPPGPTCTPARVVGPVLRKRYADRECWLRVVCSDCQARGAARRWAARAVNMITEAGETEADGD